MSDAHNEAAIVAGSLDLTRCRNIREFEAALRDAGLSRRRAKAVASRGFAGLNLPVDDDDTKALMDAVERLTHTIESHFSPGEGGDRDGRDRTRGAIDQRDARDEGVHQTQRQTQGAE